MSPRRLSFAILCVAGVCAVAGAAAAQSVAISGTSSVRYIELRTLDVDSVAVEDAPGDGLLRQLPDGRIVRCVPGDAVCRFVHSGPRESTVPMINDLEVSAWGFGEGMRVYSQLRSRTAWGRDPNLWPQSNEALEVLAAYGEIVRDRYRIRLGRQWQVSGLGFYNFDGVTAAVRPIRALWIETYGGRSLLRGLDEPRTGGALEAIEALAPPKNGVLMGADVQFRPNARLALSTAYQVDFRGDSAGLYSELAVANGSLQLGAGGSLESSVEMDVASSALHEARLSAQLPPWKRTALHAEVLRYRPYFELWTIWGAFSPVGYDEARSGATWVTSDGALMLRGDVTYRSYDAIADDGAVLGGSTFQSRGWGAAASASWTMRPAWRLEGAYDVQTGFGAAGRDGQATLVRQLGDVGVVSIQGLAFQQLYEFRLDQGTVVGLGANASLRLSDRVSLEAGYTVYRHVDAGPETGVDWNQRRGSVQLHWTMGAEPGLRPRVRPQP